MELKGLTPYQGRLANLLTGGGSNKHNELSNRQAKLAQSQPIRSNPHQFDNNNYVSRVYKTGDVEYYDYPNTRIASRSDKSASNSIDKKIDSFANALELQSKVRGNDQAQKEAKRDAQRQSEAPIKAQQDRTSPGNTSKRKGDERAGVIAEAITSSSRHNGNTSGLEASSKEVSNNVQNSIKITKFAGQSHSREGEPRGFSDQVERISTSNTQIRAQYTYEDVESMNFSRPVRIGLDIMA